MKIRTNIDLEKLAINFGKKPVEVTFSIPNDKLPIDFDLNGWSPASCSYIKSEATTMGQMKPLIDRFIRDLKSTDLHARVEVSARDKSGHLCYMDMNGIYHTSQGITFQWENGGFVGRGSA